MAYEAEIARMRGLAEVAAGDPAQQTALQTTLVRAGRALALAGETEASVSMLDEGVALARELVAAEPDGMVRKAQLATALSAVATWRTRMDDAAGAQAALTEAASLLRPADDAVDATETTHDLIVVLVRLGDTQLSLDDVDGARASYQEAETRARAAAEVDGADVTAARDLIMTLNALGHLEGTRGDLALSFDHYGQAADVARALRGSVGPQAYPDAAFADLLGQLASYGVLIEQDDEAAAVAREGLDLRPEDAWLQRSLAHAQMFQGETEAARDIYLSLVADAETREALFSEFDALDFLGRTDPLMQEVRESAGQQ